MNIFVRGVPSHVTQKQTKAFFKPFLADCGIDDFHCELMRGKPFAVITVLDASCGQRFLSKHGVPQGATRIARPKTPISWCRTYLQCTKDKKPVEETALRTLAFEADQRAASVVARPAAQTTAAVERPLTRFDVTCLHCGVWDYVGSSLAFVSYYSTHHSGAIHLGLREAIAVLQSPDLGQTRLHMSYWSCDHVVVGHDQDPTVTFALTIAPKMYQIPRLAPDELVDGVAMLGLDARNERRDMKIPKKNRLLGLDTSHERIAGTCMVYRFRLSDARQLRALRSSLRRHSKMPPTLTLATDTVLPEMQMRLSFVMLANELADTYRSGSLPFQTRYQIERLARNAVLSPLRVMQLLPKIKSLHETYGAEPTSHAIARLSRQLPFAGPDVEASEFSLARLEKTLEDSAGSYDRFATDNPYTIARRHAHIKMIHKVIVTPTGLYLEGPEPEPTNRVLRRYGDKTDNFIRVVFQDEDGASVRYDPRAIQESVYNGRFKQVLDSSIIIAGSGFGFLGFSHSSLRSQSCWFMAPMVLDGRLTYAPQVLKLLGNFEVIRTPAKCAARIGQNFTDTNSTVTIDPSKVGELPIVERNGRDFSDGVGTISHNLLKRIHRVYGIRRLLKPTLLQIRFQGAKGMVSLDSRLSGERLMLRSNMIKFETSTSWDVEICGAAFRALPMVLNRQFIKILEDLGVPDDAFLRLQTQAVNNLRCMTTSPANTATFLEEVSSTKATRLPQLITLLAEIGLNYHIDSFLYRVVEMAVINKLQELKYRGRIPVEKGFTLYGIMDETGHLREGEIFVATERVPEGGRNVLVRPQVIITRSPAMHPGDVQVVRAVDVPEDSPLQRLSNCVVFSQHGQRDLPSQLSGGDLDGDLYNVIYDDDLFPTRTCTPADYERVKPVELDRPVTGKDMSDFFVRFMQSDQLGMICNVHMQLADRRERGTFDDDCINLTGMASTAVDFSKTGIAVDMKNMPKYDRNRPNFMAPGPRVEISDAGALTLEDADVGDDDAFDGLDAELRPYRYYRSEKALGQLFEAIDERQFLEGMMMDHRDAIGSTADPSGLLDRLLRYMLHWAGHYGVLYEHHIELAREIRAGYEDSLVDILYVYGPTPHAPVTEHEAFSGTILGRRGGLQGKPLREQSKTMRERFECVVEHAVARVTRGDAAMRRAAESVEWQQEEKEEKEGGGGQQEEEEEEFYDDREIETLPRAIACLAVGVRERGLRDVKLGELRSFPYVVAGVCLREFQRYMITTFGRYSLPRIV